jgi:uncharacterized protein (DUF302 family)
MQVGDVIADGKGIRYSVRLEVTSVQEVANGISTVISNHSVDATVNKLQDILREEGAKLFALVDHSGEAESVGLKMRATKLLIFGNPLAGTPIMLAAPSSALDLPMKLLVWEDSDGRVWISFNEADYLGKRHVIPTELRQNLTIVSRIAAIAAE